VASSAQAHALHARRSGQHADVTWSRLHEIASHVSYGPLHYTPVGHSGGGLYVCVYLRGNSPYCILVCRFRVVLSELLVYGNLGVNYFRGAVPACFWGRTAVAPEMLCRSCRSAWWVMPESTRLLRGRHCGWWRTGCSKSPTSPCPSGR
jgi:hypothetical protein